VVTTADAEWPEQIRRVAAGRPLDVIIDPVGGELAIEHRLLGRPASEYGRSRHGDEGHGRGDRCVDGS